MPERPSEEETTAPGQPAEARGDRPASPDEAGPEPAPAAEPGPGGGPTADSPGDPESPPPPAAPDAEPVEPASSPDATGPPAAGDESPGGEGDLETLERRARLAEDRLAAVLAGYRQIKADNAAHRERVGRTLEQQFQRRRERLLVRFIEILDNLDRALEAAERTTAAEPLLEGLILVRCQLLRVLSDEGLERIPTLGLPFDPQVAEAVGTRPVTDPDHHHLVVREELRGYRLKGRVVRASRVHVGVYTAPPPATGEGETEDPYLGHS